jgi:hypothetical protein
MFVFASVGVPATVAVFRPVPVITSDSPCGSGKALQEYGGVPPEAVKLALYGAPTCPLGAVGGEIVSGATAGAVVSVYDRLTVASAPSDSVTRKVYVFAWMGVPERVAVAPLPENFSPGGRLASVTLQ